MSGRYILQKHIKELRFHFCQTSNSSENVRLFIRKIYPILKKHNPYVPILIREAMGVTPVLWIRYEYGKEKSLSLENLSVEECSERINSFLFET
ncbi:uncharacterized protein T551_00763 [Pneumocystis jirovecii RU7]|uniref:Ribosomal protein/NADH dehydrogenase domain-containing protein n=1 Tax=Pneumocystis jirovecii (strain RU7) TaxID=1408657 RepID=A0A0W4ZUL6_PNEJ7|nr:uncharacterized protein T551_00763 [Pneumocystis jirovecii RU7]KTW32081.1 hypothetical protein T551_00763 [Pneumocystis jirovecii RU7]